MAASGRMGEFDETVSAEGVAVSDAKTFIEQYAAIARRMVAESGEVALQAATELDNGTYGTDAWGRSMIQLSDIALRGSLDAAELITACPDAPTAPETVSKSVYVAPDSRFTRTPKVAVAFTRLGKTTTIPPDRISFEPKVLARGDTAFKVVVRRTGLVRAHYRGTVQLVPTDPPTNAQAGQTVVVTIAL